MHKQYIQISTRRNTMSLERCECCSRFLPEERLLTGESDIIPINFNRCEECTNNNALPGYATATYWHTAKDVNKLDSNKVFFDDAYISLRTYFTKTKYAY